MVMGTLKEGSNSALDTGRRPRGLVGSGLGRKSENGCWSKVLGKKKEPCSIEARLFRLDSLRVTMKIG